MTIVFPVSVNKYSFEVSRCPRGQTLRSPRPKVTSLLTRYSNVEMTMNNIWGDVTCLNLLVQYGLDCYLIPVVSRIVLCVILHENPLLQMGGFKLGWGGALHLFLRGGAPAQTDPRSSCKKKQNLKSIKLGFHPHGVEYNLCTERCVFRMGALSVWDKSRLELC